MNKWEDSFKKMDDQGLFIPNRQLSVVVAILLLLAFSLFMTGYFLGKRKAVEQFTQEMQQDAIADKIYTTVLLNKENGQPIAETLVTQVDENVVVSSTINQEIIVSEAIQDIIQDKQEQKYYAQLIGFGTEKAAQSFVKKLSAKGIETEVKKRASKTVKGQTSYWYQVVTAQYLNKDDLLHLVDKLTKEENIKDARICMC
jgi:cell division protein FtsN